MKILIIKKLEKKNTSWTALHLKIDDVIIFFQSVNLKYLGL